MCSDSQSSKSDRAASLGGNAKKAEYENLTYPSNVLLQYVSFLMIVASL